MKNRYESVERGYAKVALTDEENEFDPFWVERSPELTIFKAEGVDRNSFLGELTK